MLAAGVPDRDDGVGLAAPQVGVSVRLMVFNAAGEHGQGEELVLANPRIISSSRKQELGEEGCLSFLKLNSSELILADVEVQDVDSTKLLHPHIAPTYNAVINKSTRHVLLL